MTVSVNPKRINVSSAQKAALEFLHAVDTEQGKKGLHPQFEEYVDWLLDRARVQRQSEMVKA